MFLVGPKPSRAIPSINGYRILLESQNVMFSDDMDPIVNIFILWRKKLKAEIVQWFVQGLHG